MWLIGREWKYSDVWSGPVLIDRGLDYRVVKTRNIFMQLSGYESWNINSVAIAAGIHLFPCRTQQLRPQTPKVLGGRPPGRIGSRWFSKKHFIRSAFFVCQKSRSKASEWVRESVIRNMRRLLGNITRNYRIVKENIFIHWLRWGL